MIVDFRRIPVDIPDACLCVDGPHLARAGFAAESSVDEFFAGEETSTCRLLVSILLRSVAPNHILVFVVSPS